MKLFLVISLFLLFPYFISAQVINTATLDTNNIDIKGKLTVNAYLDAYYGYDFSNPRGGNRPYFVSMARHNEFNINLAYVDVRYTSSRFRARFVPGFGTYVNANYATEPGTLKNIIEGYVGIKLSKKQEIWLDAGVLGSPYTNESAISKDHLMYTRSFAPEYVPYYITGLKLSIPLDPKVTAYFYLINGWQVIQDNNSGKSFGTQLEWRPNDKLLVNWDTYLGDERSDAHPEYRARYFTDLYLIYNPNGKFSGTTCFYVGGQEKSNGPSNSITTATWVNFNLIGRYQINPKTSISGRLEYFSDPKEAVITPINPVGGFSTYSASLGLNIKPIDNVLIRFESRSFLSDKKVYQDKLERPSDKGLMGIANLTIFF